MNKLIKELINARKQVIEAVARVDKSKQAKAFVGEWTLKDIIAHLTGWANYQVEVIKALNNGQIPPEPGNIEVRHYKKTHLPQILGLMKS